MDKFFYYIDKFKYGILASISTYAFLFPYLQLKYITQYEPIEKLFNESKVEIPEDEIELQPENIQVQPQFSGGEVKNTSRDLNDKRQFSEKNWSRSQGNSNNKNSADSKDEFNEERKHLEEIQQQVNERTKKTTQTTKPNPSNSSTSSGSKFQYSGNVLVTYDVKSRTESLLDAPGYSCKGAGKVAIKVRVDSYGTIISSKYDSSKSSGADKCMIDLALTYAKSRSRFTSGVGNVDGYIYYTFVAQ
ncbi:MAG: hypothetical protein ACKO6A_05495 [Bacteroidota bacterium]